MASGRSRILISVCVFAGAGQAAAAPKIQRSDVHVPGEPGIALAVRELRVPGNDAGVPIVLVHGARVPGVPSFDLDVPGGSLAADLAAGGHRVFVMDVRGYGGSTRPPPREEPPRDLIARHDEAVRDIDAVVDWVRRRTAAGKVACFGWATGGSWCGMYAALHADKVSHLVLLNALYGANAPHPLLRPMEDPHNPGQLDPTPGKKLGGYALVPPASLLRPWDASIAPLSESERATWRDPAVAEAYVAAALASDPESGKRDPPSMRAPTGALEDSFYQATGRKLWDGSFVRAAVLVVRSERDFWSRPEDVSELVSHLVHAARVETLVLPGATHFVHLDRADRGRKILLEKSLAFLGTT